MVLTSEPSSLLEGVDFGGEGPTAIDTFAGVLMACFVVLDDQFEEGVVRRGCPGEVVYTYDDVTPPKFEGCVLSIVLMKVDVTVDGRGRWEEGLRDNELHRSGIKGSVRSVEVVRI